jgi:hypothetical protein
LVLAALLASYAALLPRIEAARSAQEQRLAAVQQAPQRRFYALAKSVEDAACSRSPARVEDAVSCAIELLAQAPRFAFDTEYGNAIHYSSIVLGRDALLHGEIDNACQYLRAAGHAPSSPQLAMYGPDMTLARELLLKGQKEVVFEYFELCNKLWLNQNRQALVRWSSDIDSGRIPNFGSLGDCE